jgi:hypothetical protein
MPRKASDNTESTTIKLTRDLLERAERLTARVNENPLRFADATRTDVLRVALMLGMKLLEERENS